MTGKQTKFVGIGLALLILTWIGWSMLSGVDPVEDRTSSAQPLEESAPEQPRVQPVTSVKKDRAKEADDPQADYVKAREAMLQIQGLLADMERLKALYMESDPARYKHEISLLKEKMNQLKKEIRPLLAKSESARNELLDMVESEEDEKIQKGLVKNFRGLDADTQADYYSQLGQSSSEKNRELGVKMLSGVPHEKAMEGLVSIAHESENPPKLKSKAVMGLAMSLDRAKPDDPYRTTASARLRSLAQSSPDPKVRESAYRAIAFKSNPSVADGDLLNQSLENESDPKVRRAAEFALKIFEKRSKM